MPMLYGMARDGTLKKGEEINAWMSKDGLQVRVVKEVGGRITVSAKDAIHVSDAPTESVEWKKALQGKLMSFIESARKGSRTRGG